MKRIILHFFIITAAILPAESFAYDRCFNIKSLFTIFNRSSITHKQFLQKLKMGEVFEGSPSFISFTNSENKLIQARIVSQTEVEGAKRLLIIDESGKVSLLDPIQNKTIAISKDSENQWINHAKTVSDQGDQSFITYISEDHKIYHSRILGYTNDRKMFILQGRMGGKYTLSTERTPFMMVSSESKKLFLESELGTGEKVFLQKNMKEIARKKDEILRGVQDFDISKAKKIGFSNSGTDETIFPAYQLADGLENTKIGKMALSVRKKFNTEVLYSEEANTAKKTNGFSSPGVKMFDEAGNPTSPSQKIVNNYILSKKGIISDTDIHEAGHMMTANRLNHGIPDPGGIKHHAVNESKLLTRNNPNFYTTYSQADESRQHAMNFLNSIHQRHTGELMGEFNQKGSLPVHSCYGVNRSNFFEAMDYANTKLEDLRTLNDRHFSLAHDAGLRVLKDLNGNQLPKDYKIYKTTNINYVYLRVPVEDAFVDIPVVGKALEEILKPLKSEKGVYHFKDHPENLKLLKDYTVSYLQNEITILDHQNIAIYDSKIKLAELRKDPDRLLNQEQYFEYQNVFSEVKRSVNFSDSKIENLKWTIPR